MATATLDRPRVFLDVAIGGQAAGRMTIELFADKTPKTCENFRALCTGTEPPLSYKRSIFHRVIEDFMIQGGDTTKANGTGGASIYGSDFEDENVNWREIDTEGLVCMANRGKDTNSSQFFITLGPCPHLNGKHTIFGRLVMPASLQTLKRVAVVEVDEDDKPLKDVTITHCGELVRRGQQQSQTQRAVPAPSTTAPEPRKGASRSRSPSSSSSPRGRPKPRSGAEKSKRQRSSSSHSQSRSATSSSSKHSESRSGSRAAKSHKTSHGDGRPYHSSRHDHNLDEIITSAKVSRSPSRSRASPQISRADARRSSDHFVDENRRGRERHRQRGESADRDEGDGGGRGLTERRQRRDKSPSRSERSKSPIDEAGDRGRNTEVGDGHAGYRRRRSLPNHYARVRKMEQERRGGARDGAGEKPRDGDDRGDRRQHDPAQEHGSSRRRGGGDDRRYNVGSAAYARNSGYSRQDEGRLGGGYDAEESSEPTIKFKGRGSMKYREREQQGQGRGGHYLRR